MTREEQIQQRLDQMPISCRGMYKKAVKKKSMRAALNSFCLECVGYQREEVKACTDLACPLWAYRPYSVSEKAHISHFRLVEATNAA
ncbi:MAG: hypothetical protein ISS70_17745 [Phycisphaerae bacterium]|nr:hypothetical protein [Phycisphaerae bacterium]